MSAVPLLLEDEHSLPPIDSYVDQMLRAVVRRSISSRKRHLANHSYSLRYMPSSGLRKPKVIKTIPDAKKKLFQRPIRFGKDVVGRPSKAGHRYFS